MKSQWPIPPFIDKQYSLATSTTPYANADNCVEQALCHAIWMMTGRRYSPRALGYMVDVTPQGSEIEQAVRIANIHGFIPYELWPNLETFTWDEYYSPIPQEVLDKAEFLDIELIPADINQSPILDVLEFNPNLKFPGPYHMVTQFSDTQFFDSQVWNGDENMVRTIPFLGSIIEWKSSIKINKLPKGAIMSQFKTQNYKGELRIVLEADSEQTWEALCKVYGVDPKTINEIID